MNTSFKKLAWRSVIVAATAVLVSGCATTYQAYYPADDGYYYADAEGAYYSGASVYYEDGYYGGGNNVYFGVGYNSGAYWWPYYGPYWYGPNSGVFFSFGYLGPWYSGYLGWGYPWYSYGHLYGHQNYYPPQYGWPHYYWGYPGYDTDVPREVARVVNNRSNWRGATSRGGVGQTPTSIVPKSTNTRTAWARDGALRGGGNKAPARSSRYGTSSANRGSYTTDSQGRIRRASGDAAWVARGQTNESPDSGRKARKESAGRSSPRGSSSSRTDLPANARVVSRGRGAGTRSDSADADSPRRSSGNRSYYSGEAAPSNSAPKRYRSVRRTATTATRLDPDKTRVRRTREDLRASVGGVRQRTPPARTARYKQGSRGRVPYTRGEQAYRAGRGSQPPASSRSPRSYAGVPARTAAPPVNTAAPPPPQRSAPPPDGGSRGPAPSYGRALSPSSSPGKSSGRSSRGSSGSRGSSSRGSSSGRSRGGRR